MNAAILACSSLAEFIKAVQAEQNTKFPVYYLDKNYHRSPKLMREQIVNALREIPEEYDTILVAMGFCGGSWENVQADRRIVVPRIDDCYSLLLTTDNNYKADRKEPGHIYVKGSDPQQDSIRRIFKKYTKKMKQEDAELIYNAWKDSYDSFDIIDTGVHDCHSEQYIKEVKADAAWLQAETKYVRGTTLLLEKLITMKWDRQFAVIEPGQIIGRKYYFDSGPSWC